MGIESMDDASEKAVIESRIEEIKAELEERRIRIGAAPGESILPNQETIDLIEEKTRLEQQLGSI